MNSGEGAEIFFGANVETKVEDENEKGREVNSLVKNPQRCLPKQ